MNFYLTRKPLPLVCPPPSPLIIGMLPPPLFQIRIPLRSTPVLGILLPKGPVILPFPQPLACNGTGLLTITHSRIREKPSATVMTFSLGHLISPFLRNLRWLISASLSISPFNSPLSTNDLYTKYTNDSSVTKALNFLESI